MFLYTGTPISRVDKFQPLLERSGFSLSDASNLKATYIPRVEERELELLKQEVFEQFVGFHFDGTTRL